MILSFYRKLRKTLKLELLVFTILVAVIPGMLVGTISYYIYASIIINNAIKSTNDLQTQTDQSINYALTQIVDIIDRPLYSDNFIELSRIVNRTGSVNDSASEFGINKFIAQLYYSNKYIHSILFLTKSDLFFSIGGEGSIKRTRYSDVEMKQWSQDIINNDGVSNWKEAGSYEYLVGNNEDLLVIGRLFKDTTTLNPLGLFIINVHSNILSDQYSSIDLKYSGKFFIINNEGIIISHPDKENIGSLLDFTNYPTEILSGKQFTGISPNGKSKNLIVSTAIGDTGWKLVSEFPYGSLTAEADKIKWISITIVLISTILVFLFSLKFSSTVIYPINQLINSMKKIKHGDFDVRMNISSYDEINVLSSNFNSMAANIQTLLRNVYEVNLQKSEADLKVTRSKLQALQSQINPHFIYNTLESLNVLAKVNKQTEISNMILSLARFFRLSLSKGNEIIQIRQELEMVVEYANLQKINHSLDFTFDIKLESRISDYYIVKFTLQPLIENCIYHGLAGKQGIGSIVISCAEDEESITIFVMDDGAGMSQEALELLNTQMQTVSRDENDISNGFGVNNVNSRLKLHFGNQYGLSFLSNETGGLTAIVRIPKILSIGGTASFQK